MHQQDQHFTCHIECDIPIKFQDMKSESNISKIEDSPATTDEIDQQKRYKCFNDTKIHHRKHKYKYPSSSSSSSDENDEQDIIKVIKVYYKGTCQDLSVADNTKEKEIFQIMKRIFRIEENIDQFFLQDSEGRIVILPKKLPNNLSVFLYVRQSTNIPSIKPTIKSPKWKFICTKGTEKQLVDGTHYYYINSPDTSYPTVISSINFSEGKHFSIIKIDSHGCGWIGFGIPGSPPEYFNPGWHCGYQYSYISNDKLPTFIKIREGDVQGVSKLIGVAIDCDSRTGYFLQVNSDTFDPLKIVTKVTDLPESVLIFAGVKGWECIKPPFTGITLVRSSLPFPDLSGFTPQEIISWNMYKTHTV